MHSYLASLHWHQLLKADDDLLIPYDSSVQYVVGTIMIPQSVHILFQNLQICYLLW